MSLIVNVDVNYSEWDKIKLKQFVEDPDYTTQSFYMLHQEVKEWRKANPNIKFINMNYSVWEDTNDQFIGTEEYRRAINLKYIGETNNENCIHIIKKTVIDKEPTCQEEGHKKCFCKVCGTIQSEEDLPKIDHKYTWTFNNDGTCITNATKTGKCSMCDNEITEEIPDSKTDHIYPEEWTVRIEATEEQPGLKFKQCTVCGNEITEVIPIISNFRYVYNGDKTHTKIDNNGIETIENCSPCGSEDVCEKCLHEFPLVLKISTEYIDAMEADSEVSFQLQSNVKNKTEDEVWTIVDGSLPDGIILSETGLFSGTVDTLASGEYNISIQCKYKNQVDVKSYSIHVASKICTVTFNANGGTVNGKSTYVAKLAAGSVLGSLPEAVYNGKVFGGWFTAAVDGLKIDESFSVSADVTFWARFGDSDSDINFGDNTTQFNIQLRNDRTNYNDSPYTLYSRYKDDSVSNLAMQTGFSSDDRSNNITDTNKKVILYLKVFNQGESGDFDIGFDCDSYLVGDSDDKVQITRIADGVKLGVKNNLSVTCLYENTVWIGKYNERTSHRYDNVSVGTTTGNNQIDTGYCLTMKNIHINKNTYVILEVTFQIP